MSSLEKPQSNRRWRSLAELADEPQFRAFLEAEFPAEADAGGVTRRRWLQLMGASLALAGAAGGCHWPKTELVPESKRSVDRVPGEPQRFATAIDLGSAAVGLLVTSVDGRPIKIEGNPAHPQSLGGTSALTQASILQLYDPDRSAHPLQRTDQGPRSQQWQQFVQFARAHFGELSKSGGEGFVVLAEGSSSPTLARQRAQLPKAFPKATWLEYEPFSRDNERLGTALAFGKPYRPHFKLRGAEVIVVLDDDMLLSHPAAVEYARDFAQGREGIHGQMNRLYAVESSYSVTGSAADHRLPLRSGQIGPFAAALEKAVIDGGKVGDSPAGDEADRYLRAIAKDLVAHRGRSVVTVGPQQPPEVHATVCRINAALGNAGETVVYFDEPDAQRPTHRDAIRLLAADMHAGKVQTLLILGGNPVYNAPADLDFEKALANVKTAIHLGLYADETARQCAWHLPQAHYLESWGDARSWDGTYSVVQPLIEPLLGGRSALAVVSLVLGDQTPSAMDQVRATFGELAGSGDLDARWRETVHAGLLKDSAWSPKRPELQAADAKASPSSGSQPAATPLPSSEQQDLEIVFIRSAPVYDGRYANNAWLQEMPEPITKLTWDNAALLSPATAASLGVQNETMVRLSYRGRELLMPAYVLPGQAAGSVAVALGYGRQAAGSVGGDVSQGVAAVGADTYRLRTSDALDFDGGLTIKPTGQPYSLATTQDHHAIDLVGLRARDARVGELIREATLEHYRKHPEFAEHSGEHPPMAALWEEPSFSGHRWGLSIDLSKCIGCGACAVACQAENNVPVVGREHVRQGREMHWLRVDRYFVGDPERPRANHQVVLCQQCENAPCEQVCPVAATMHNREGLNDMVYNRCIGTRYCSNNCPFKVRRFNFFNYHKNLEEPANELLKMVNNPQVTVRGRGVMEKCTYCVQRIEVAKIEAKNQRRPIADGEIRTACQQVCPSGAIVFGDLSDRASGVSRRQASDRAYSLLAELNIKPRTRYLAKIRNPNAELEDA